jgi:hypothetical protein
VLKELFLCKDYLVSDEGYVLSKSGKRLKPSTNPHGYQIINISDNGHTKGLSVHTAVMMAFNPDGKLDESYQINHIDGNKLNNHIDNLEWVTPKENMRHSVDVLGTNLRTNNGNAKSIYGVNKKDKSVIEFNTLIDAGEYFNPNNSRFGQNSIWRALSGRRKSAYGYIWYYKT